MLAVNERTTAWVTVVFKDKTGALAAPATVTYRIDCLTTGAAIKGTTSIAAASSVEITVTDEENAIQNTGNAREQRRVTVIATYGAGDQITSEYDYMVRNLEFVT